MTLMVSLCPSMISSTGRETTRVASGSRRWEAMMDQLLMASSYRWKKSPLSGQRDSLRCIFTIISSVKCYSVNDESDKKTNIYFVIY